MAGNIVKVKDGHYRLRYKDSSRYVKAKSDREAERLLAKFVTEVDAGDFKQPSKVTFREFSQKWLKDYAEIELAPKTVYRYKELLEGRIYPAFGDKKLDKLRPLDLVGFYNSLRKKHKYMGLLKDGTREEKQAEPLSEQTIKHYHRLISAIFEKAIKWEILRGSNPAKHVDAPKTEKKKAKCYDEKHVQALLDALDKLGPEELKYKAATMIALMTGARLGEIMGLEWQDIDFTNKAIEIRQSSQYLPGEGIFTKDPKTETSKRRISVNDTLLKLLEEYKNSQRDKGFLCQDSNRLFLAWDGQPMHPLTLSKWFPEFLKDNKLPPLNFHGLRHTSATFLISRGMDIQTVAGRLGHSTSATTQNVYSHFLESKDRQAAELMEDTFSKKQKINNKSKKEAK
ncbi:tyrosine-type recombinase/integrase [Desulforamulus aquiferis]|uniref:Site-specific integrase n=1 Tax=Desulforamulus aquiferis TaxID=1397668 RepID=A0AAW7Z9M4_9FIRM|nr:site-specific integrase [Desulforamulus aquiferis]MDO7786115.1 site-specific integrase [Desulforamulus aquiferis]